MGKASVKLTALFLNHSSTIKIHKSTCGMIPLLFDEIFDTKKEHVYKTEIDGELHKTRFYTYRRKNWGSSRWLQPLPLKTFVKVIFLAAKTLNKNTGVVPSVCVKCCSYELITIRYERIGDKIKRWWVESKE